jgi:hypothetical protein
MRKLKVLSGALLILLLMAGPMFAAESTFDTIVTGVASTYYMDATGTHTLTYSEMNKMLIVLSSGTGVETIIAPDEAGRAYIVRVNTGGAQCTSVAFRTSSTAGVSIAVDKTAMVYHNGTKYIRVTADATNE